MYQKRIGCKQHNRPCHDKGFGSPLFKDNTTCFLIGACSTTPFNYFKYIKQIFVCSLGRFFSENKTIANMYLLYHIFS